MADGPAVDMTCIHTTIAFCAAVGMNSVFVNLTHVMTQMSPPFYRGTFHAACQRIFGPNFVLTNVLIELMTALQTADPYENLLEAERLAEMLFL